MSLGWARLPRAIGDACQSGHIKGWRLVRYDSLPDRGSSRLKSCTGERRGTWDGMAKCQVRSAQGRDGLTRKVGRDSWRGVAWRGVLAFRVATRH